MEERGPHDEELAQDLFLAGNAKNPKKILIYFRGTHGNEFRLDAAVQLKLLTTISASEINANALLVFLNLNPFGEAWDSRTDAENRDLGRFFISGESNPDYAQLDKIINPKDEKPPSFRKLVWQILPHYFPKKKRDKTKRILTAGQREFPKGLFFGGNEEPAADTTPDFLQLIEELPLAGAQTTVVEGHTGGGRHPLSIFLQAGNSTRLPAEVRKTVEKTWDPWVSELRGGVVEYFKKVYGKGELDYLLTESKTYHELITFYRVVLANWVRHRLAGLDLIEHESARLALDGVHRSDRKWQAEVFREKETLIRELLEANEFLRS